MKSIISKGNIVKETDQTGRKDQPYKDLDHVSKDPEQEKKAKKTPHILKLWS